MSYKGTVESVVSRTVNTKYGPKPVFDLMMEDGGKFAYGWKNPTKEGISDGAVIEFEFTSDRYGNKITDGTLSVITSGSGAAVKPSAPAAPRPVGGGAPSRDLGFPVPVTSDKISIIRQNALTNARELVSMYPAVFDVEGDKDRMVKAILDVARLFADYTSGRDVEAKLKKLSDKMEE